MAVCCTVAPCGRQVPPTAGGPMAPRLIMWICISGHRSMQGRHKQTRTLVWLPKNSGPVLVEAELAARLLEPWQSNLRIWNKRLSRHSKAGQYNDTMKLFEQMQLEGMNPDKFTFCPVLNACTNLRDLEQGKQIHLKIIQTGCQSDVYVASCLVDMYAKCGSIEAAWTVFKNMPVRNVVTWSAMIMGYVKCGEGQKAVVLSRQMQQEGVDPNPIAFVSVLNACASVGALEEGRRVHEEIIKRGFESDVFVGTCLVDMYAKCGSIDEAHRVFNKMPTRNVVVWSSIVLGYVKCGEGQKSIKLFRQMQTEGVYPNAVTFVGVLNACASVGALEEGRDIHMQIIERGYESNVFVSSCLVDMYAKCGSIGDAQGVFNQMLTRDVVAWSSMIQGYVNCGEGKKALELYREMQEKGVDPNPVTFVAVLNGCASLNAIQEGRLVHTQIVCSGYESDVFVGSCLVDMYAKCGCIEEAQLVFSKMSTRNVVAWSAMILGYVICGDGQKALELSQQMQQDGVEPNPVTFVAMLNACASVAALEEGRRVHKQIVERGYERDVFLGSSLVNMYAKCGSVADAQSVFNKMPVHNVVSWTAMLGGYAMHGDAHQALEHFKRMCQEDIQIDGVTFVSLLSACSHGGLVDEGLHYFESMAAVYNISPTLEHFACVVDLLGRANRLHEAEDMIAFMPGVPDANVLMPLLGACGVHNNIKVGEKVGKQVLKVDPKNASGYVLLSNIYAAAGKWEHSAIVKQQGLVAAAKKELGRTWIEVNGKVHSFAVDDRKHPRNEGIRAGHMGVHVPDGKTCIKLCG